MSGPSNKIFTDFEVNLITAVLPQLHRRKCSFRPGLFHLVEPLPYGKLKHWTSKQVKEAVEQFEREQK